MTDEATATSRWAGVSRALEAETGLHFEPRRWGDMERGLARAAERLGLPGATACGDLLLAHQLDDAQRHALAECLAIGETYFFRDPGVFEVLGRDVLPPLIAQRRGGSRHLRLWSAGCSTGEEPHSLAMLLAGVLPDWRDWNLSILATDLNESALARGRAGVYGPWSLRGNVPGHARAYLRPAPSGRHEVAAELRAMVRFAPLNLVSGSYPALATGTGAMDLIVCRNVLIYFEVSRARQVLERLGQCLVPGGWLVTGSVEAPLGPVPGLELRRFGDVSALQRMPLARPAPRPRDFAGRADLPSAAPAAAGKPAPAAVGDGPALPQAEPPVGATHGTAAAGEAASLGARARALADAGDHEHAEALCRRLVDLEKLEPDWTWLLASVLHERGAHDEAMQVLRRTLYLDPQHVAARILLATLGLRHGAAAAARKHLAVALSQLDTRSPHEVVRASGGLSVRELQATAARLAACA